MLWIVQGVLGRLREREKDVDELKELTEKLQSEQFTSQTLDVIAR